MSWLEHHRLSEQYASEAEVALYKGQRELVYDLYSQAADAEEAALESLDTGKTRTLGISAVSAVALRYKAQQFKQAESLAYRWLACANLPAFAHDELKILIQTIWNEQVRQQAGAHFATGQVMVSIKGGKVVSGGAPLDLILDKIKTVQSLFYRTAEYLQRAPHRKHGTPNQEIQNICQPWLFQAPAGSYQFAVAIEENRQLDFLRSGEPSSKDIANQFLEILRASVEDPDEGLRDLVQDKEYRDTFLKLTRNLAPTGHAFERMDVRSSDEKNLISLIPSVRKEITQTLRRNSPKRRESLGSEEISLRGVLRAVHLDQDWLEITIGTEHIRVTQLAEAVDDIIGAMVNRPVIVQVVRDRKGHHLYRDIESAE